MYWLRKWLESHNICTFSTWKDKCLFNLLFWIPNLFCTFHDLVGEELTSFPPWRPVTEFLSFRFFNNLLALKNRGALKLFTVLKYFFIFQDFWATCACPEKQSLPWKFSLHWNTFYLSGFVRNLSLPWKQSLSWTFSLHLIYFLHLGCLSNFCLPWKTECALNSLYWIWTFNIQNFEQLALALKNTVCPEIFHCIEIFFIFQDFWGTWACPENRVFLENFNCIEYSFYIQDFWATCACPEKQSVPWIHCIEYIFLIIQHFEQPALSLKNKICPENFLMYWNIFYHSGFLRNLRLP